MKIGTVYKAISSKALIKSQYLVSPRESIQQYKSFTLTNMNVEFPQTPFPISSSSITMPSSTKAMSTFKSSTTSIVKATGTDTDITETMKQKK